MRSRDIPLALSARTRKGFTLFWAALFVLSLLLQYGSALAPSNVLAVHNEGLFELDGNAQDDSSAAGQDWDTATKVLIPDPVNNNADTIFTGGSTKDDLNISGWHWTTGKPPAKDDISNAFVTAYDKNGTTFLYFGLDRYANNGDAQVGFWFLKSAAGPAAGGAFSGAHQVGDLLVLSHFTNGGSVSTIELYEWVGSGGDTNGTLNHIASGNVCTGSPATDMACAVANSADTPAIWAFTPKFGTAGTYPAGSFFEGGINLDEAFGGSAPCFTGFIAETRTSQAVDAVLKDFASGLFSSCVPPTIETAVSDDIILTGGSVTDTATLSGNKGPVEGTIQFAVCGPEASAPDCTTGGVLVGSPVTIANDTATSPPFSPTQPGAYCFRAEYTPAAGSKYLAASHTNQTTECFELVPPPTVQVIKTASPTSVNEPGGNVTFTVAVTNTSSHDVTLSSLTDSIHLDLNGQGTCVTGGTITVGATYTCTFTATVSGDAGDSETDIVTAEVVDAYEQIASDTDDAIVQVADVLPVIEVVKTADPTTVPETGGTVTYSVTVTNKSVEPVTITSLSDDVYGNLDGKGTCDIGAVLAPSESYSCSFDELVEGSAGSQVTDVVTANAVDNEENTATDSDDATVVIGDVLPFIQVTKSATPTSVEEPGGNVSFDVTVTNVGDVGVTVTSLSDDVYGNLHGKGTCDIGAVLAPSESYSCSFTGAVSGDAGDTATDTVTAIADDADGNHATDSDDATVQITDALPDITVVKTANPTQLNEPGGDVTFTVEVTNNSVEPVMLTSLVDDIHGDLNGQGDCVTGGTIAVGATYTCEFTAPVSGDVGDTETDTVTAVAVDNEQNQATDSDQATVEITDLLPAISVQKTANPLSVQEPGGDVTFTVEVTNDSTEPVTLTSLVDNVYGDLNGEGDCETDVTIATGDTYTCSFTGAVSGSAGSVHVDTVTAEAMDNEGNTATDSDDATVTVTAQPTGTIIIEKQTNPDGSGQAFDFIASWEDAFTLTDGQTHEVSGLIAGTYNVFETDIPAGWTLTSISGDEACNEDGGVYITLGAGQTVHCIFTNTLRETPPPPPPPNPSMTIAKTNGTTGAVEPGTAVAFTLTIGVQNATSIANTTIVDQLPAGIGNATAISDGGVYNAVTNQITWTSLTVTNGKKLTYTATVSVTATAGAYVNTATITQGPCVLSCSSSSTVTVEPGEVLGATSAPRITLPPTNTIDGENGSSPSINLGLILLVLAGLATMLGFLTPVPSWSRRRSRRR